MRVIEIIHALREIDPDQEVFFINIMPNHVMEECKGQPSLGLTVNLPMDDIQFLKNDSDSMSDETIAVGTFKNTSATH